MNTAAKMLTTTPTTGANGESMEVAALKSYLEFIPTATPYQEIAARRDRSTIQRVRSRFQRINEDNNDVASAPDSSSTSDTDAIERTPLAQRFQSVVDQDDDIDEDSLSSALSSVPSNLSDDVDPCLKARRLWLELLKEQGYDALCQELLQDELNVRWAKKSSSVGPADQSWMAYYGRMILASTDRTLLEAIIHGNVSRERRSNKKLELHLQELWAQSEKQPSIYMQAFVNVNGLSPTPTEIEDLCKLMERYLNYNDNKFANEVDDIFNKTAKAKRALYKDYRAYMWSEQVDPKKKGNYVGKALKKHMSWMQSKQMVENMESLLEALRERMKAIPQAEWNKPLEHPLVEYGYADHSPSRLKQHARHDSSNYLMNLMEAVACWAYTNNVITTQYRMEQCVIYLIWQRPQAHLSEIIWTSLGEGYIHNGGGFSHYPAGRSNESIWRNSEQTMELAHGYMRTYSPLLDNLQIDIARIKKQADELQGDIRALDKATGDAKSEKERVLKGKYREMQAKVLAGLERRKAALLESVSYHYQFKLEDMTAEMGVLRERAQKLNEAHDATAVLRSPEIQKWLK